MNIEEAKDAIRMGMKMAMGPDRPSDPEPELDLEELYDGIMDLQQELRRRVGAMALADFTHPCVAGPMYDYRLIKALAATYDLQEYLAYRLAETVEAGEMEPDLE